MCCDAFAKCTYSYLFGLGMSLDWSSQTAAGSRNGGCGIGATVDVGGTIGPWLVFQSTLIASVLDKYVSITTMLNMWH